MCTMAAPLLLLAATMPSMDGIKSLPLREWLPHSAVTNVSESASPEVIHFVWMQETRQRQVPEVQLPAQFASQRKPRMLQNGAWEDSVYAHRFADNVARWRRLNPASELRLWRNQDCASAAQAADQRAGGTGLGVASAFQALGSQKSGAPVVARSDLCRVAIVYAVGGAYADLDVIPFSPFGVFLEHAGFNGAGGEHDTLAVQWTDYQLATSVLYAPMPGSPALKDTLMLMVRRIQASIGVARITSTETAAVVGWSVPRVIFTTGPNALTAALFPGCCRNMPSGDDVLAGRCGGAGQAKLGDPDSDGPDTKTGRGQSAILGGAAHGDGPCFKPARKGTVVLRPAQWGEYLRDTTAATWHSASTATPLSVFLRYRAEAFAAHGEIDQAIQELDTAAPLLPPEPSLLHEQIEVVSDLVDLLLKHHVNKAEGASPAVRARVRELHRQLHRNLLQIEGAAPETHARAARYLQRRHCWGEAAEQWQRCFEMCAHLVRHAPGTEFAGHPLTQWARGGERLCRYVEEAVSMLASVPMNAAPESSSARAHVPTLLSATGCMDPRALHERWELYPALATTLLVCAFTLFIWARRARRRAIIRDHLKHIFSVKAPERLEQGHVEQLMAQFSNDLDHLVRLVEAKYGDVQGHRLETYRGSGSGSGSANNKTD